MPQGTFAIKIKDWNKFVAFRNNREIWTNSNEGREGKIDKLRHIYNKITPTGDFNRMKNALLEIFKEFNAGVGLYEASEDLSSWQELELAPGATYLDSTNQIKKPC